MAKSNVTQWDTTAANNTDVGGINVDEGCAAANVNNALREVMAQVATALSDLTIWGSGSAPGVVRSSLLEVSSVNTKAGNYTATTNDRSKCLRFTTTATLSVTASSTMGNDWYTYVKADGGHVTVDPNGSETVDGAATIVIYDGSSAIIFSDGSNLFSIGRPTSATASEVDLTNSGANDLTEVDFTSIPANVSKVTVFFNDASFSGSDDLLVQLSTSSTFVTTGYESTSRVNSSNTSSTSGFAVIMSAQRSGIVELTRYPGTNRWMASHNAEAAVGSGHITLAGALDGVRLTRTGSNTFDGGTALISYS